jgi:hypothetical protein
MKPNGFWVSVDGDDDWESWCKDNNFGLGRLSYRHEVILAKDANVLVLTSADEVRCFHKEYHSREDAMYVDWTTVATKYQGIIIAPYQWSLRLSNIQWYYSWDCASGCIWDVKAISKVTAKQSINAE